MTEYQRHRDERERRSDLNRVKIASPVYWRIRNDAQVLLTISTLSISVISRGNDEAISWF